MSIQFNPAMHRSRAVSELASSHRDQLHGINRDQLVTATDRLLHHRRRVAVSRPVQLAPVARVMPTPKAQRRPPTAAISACVGLASAIAVLLVFA